MAQRRITVSPDGALHPVANDKPMQPRSAARRKTFVVVRYPINGMPTAIRP
jgi:hypothetical protein